MLMRYVSYFTLWHLGASGLLLLQVTGNTGIMFSNEVVTTLVIGQRFVEPHA